MENQKTKPQIIERRKEEVYIDVNNAGKPFPHFWEKTFGSCHASITLAEDWRKDIDTLNKTVDVEHVRFHGIFDKETGIYAGEDENGNLILNFTRIDQIYDGLLAHGVRPFVELSFMPPGMADDIEGSVHPFKYHPIVSPPKDPTKWYELIHRFTSHLVNRYGVDEVSQWYFEVWNEPNIDFLAGDSNESKQRAYFMMYDLAAHAVKNVDARLRVGGPATAMAAWIPDFIAHCVEKTTPVDFVSTHIYPNDWPIYVFGKELDISQKDMVALTVKKVYDEVKASGLPDLPIFWTEFNAGFDGGQTDLPYVGPWLANTIARCDGLATQMAYWTFTDNFFEEGGVFPRPFYNGFGLIATGSIPKAPFNAFKLLNLLGELRLPVNSEDAILTRRDDGTIVLAIWNYVAPKQKGDAVTFEITLNDHSNGLACVHVVDATHGNPLGAWDVMGRPDFPTPAQQLLLRRAAQLPPATVATVTDGKLSVTAEPDALIVIQFINTATAAA
jgi:xylan 1,4-beta-xylosidase